MLSYNYKGLKIAITIKEEPKKVRVGEGYQSSRDVVRWFRNVEISATLLGMDIANLEMISFVKGQLQAYLHMKQGELKAVNEAFGDKAKGYLHFRLSIKNNVKYLLVIYRKIGGIIRKEYYTYAEVVQMATAIDKVNHYLQPTPELVGSYQIMD